MSGPSSPGTDPAVLQTKGDGQGVEMISSELEATSRNCVIHEKAARELATPHPLSHRDFNTRENIPHIQYYPKAQRQVLEMENIQPAFLDTPKCISFSKDGSGNQQIPFFSYWYRMLQAYAHSRSLKACLL